jgi:hypothetical protein
MRLSHDGMGWKDVGEESEKYFHIRDLILGSTTTMDNIKSGWSNFFLPSGQKSFPVGPKGQKKLLLALFLKDNSHFCYL